MLNDVYMEYMVKPPKSGRQKAVTALVIAAGIILSLVMVLIIYAAAFALMGTQFGSFAFSIGLVLIALMWYGVYLIIGMQNYEYEYLLTNSEIDIDKIMSKKGRKRVISFDFREVSICANVDDEEHNSAYKNNTADKTLSLIGDAARGNVYFADFTKDGERLRVLFQPTSKMIGEIKKFNPRNIFVSD